MRMRTEQFEVLQDYAEAVFVAEMAAHLRSFAPRICEIVGAQGVNKIAESGIKRARSYGLENRGPIGFFLQLTCSLGTGFDTDPQLQWAAETLTDDSIQTDMLRIELLHKQMVVYFDLIAGPNNQYATQAIKKAVNFDPMQAPAGGWSQQAIMDLLAYIHPQKFNFIGEAVAAVIIRKAVTEVEIHQLPVEKGAVAVLAGIQFALGHRICEDPFYPWIAATLENTRIIDREQKLNRLSSKLQTYGKHALAYLLQPGQPDDNAATGSYR
jgi:hypothetical protein